MGEKKVRVAILRKMTNLENDDRLRKEFSSLIKMYPFIEAKIFAVMDGIPEHEGVTSYGLPYRSICLKSRNKLASGKHLVAKSWDYYCSIKKELRDYDIVWNSGDEPTGVLLFVHHKYIIWDLRELPMFLLGSKFKEIVLKYLFHKCDLMFHANQYRIDYLQQKGLVKKSGKHFVLRNYPDFSVVDTEYDSRYFEVKEWIGDRTCVYLQGLNDDSRAAIECISAVLNTPGLCAIVLGRFYDKALGLLNNKYGEETIKERICFAGNFKVLKIPQYMALCRLSLIFYKKTSPNNWYCEANRLYQALDTGLPVVVGANPSMKSVVEDLGVGVSVDTDGRDISLIEKGIATVLENRDKYVDNIKHLSNEITWDSQESTLKTAINTIINKIRK